MGKHGKGTRRQGSGGIVRCECAHAAGDHAGKAEKATRPCSMPGCSCREYRPPPKASRSSTSTRVPQWERDGNRFTDTNG